MADTTEVAKIDSVPEAQQVNLFSTKDLFEHIQRVAVMFSKSELIPKRYQGNPGNCVIALEMANRIGASPLMVMQNLDIIMGRPAWSSKFLIATLNASGKFSPIRYESDDKNGGRTRAWAIDKMNGEKVYGAWVSMEMAKAEGWVDKNGSKWKTMPELMIRYRAASFFTNQFAPEISMGLQTVEEVYDILPPERDSNIAADILTTDITHDDVIDPPETKSEESQEQDIRKQSKPVPEHLDKYPLTPEESHDPPKKQKAVVSADLKKRIMEMKDAEMFVTYVNSLTHLHDSKEFKELVLDKVGTFPDPDDISGKLIF